MSPAPGEVPTAKIVPLAPAIACDISTSMVPSFNIFLTFFRMLPATSRTMESRSGGAVMTISDSGFIRNVDRSANPMIAVLSSEVRT